NFKNFFCSHGSNEPGRLKNGKKIQPKTIALIIEKTDSSFGEKTRHGKIQVSWVVVIHGMASWGLFKICKKMSSKNWF
ncbi:MAG: hypothetical protein R6U68_09870, partial [Desulfobacteraceae bacterium]